MAALAALDTSAVTPCTTTAFRHSQPNAIQVESKPQGSTCSAAIASTEGWAAGFGWGRLITGFNGLCNAGVLMTPRSLLVRLHGTHRINAAGNACSERQDLRDKNMLMKYKAYSEQEHLNSGMTEGYNMWTNQLPSC